MNRRQKLVQQQFLNNEEAVIRRLEQIYREALKEIDRKIERLMKQFDPETGELPQSAIYQIQYQQMLKGQIEGILNQLQTKQFLTVSDYLSGCYEDGFIGNLYDLHGQGIPLTMPLDQTKVVRAVQLDSKISKGLYTRLGEDVADLKKKITSEVSRSILTGESFARTAKRLSNYTRIGYNNAIRIARTEGHRIQTTATMDSMEMAKERGADILKQWDATLDDSTRESHAAVDGEIREVDEPFSNGLDFPGDPAGSAAEVINCRCALLQRARWALDEDELQTLKDRAEYFGLDKAETFEDFKKKYLKAVEDIEFIPAKTLAEAEDFARQMGVKYAVYSNLPLDTANEINKALKALPDGVRPVFVGDSSTLEKCWGGKLPRSSKQYYGVTIDTFDGIHLGYGNGIDFNTSGQMVGISYSYRTADKITAAKKVAQARYAEKHNGNTWFFNVDGRTTPHHEAGHVYANIKGLPDGFEEAAMRWAKEARCDMISNPAEAWAEAWASYHTGINIDAVPEYILDFIRKAVGQ